MTDDSTALVDLAAYPWLPYVLMPCIIAFVGWSTNWLGIMMMFHPHEFKGVGPLGWQGIVPRIREKLARDMTEITVKTICSPQDMIDAIDQSDAVSEIGQLLDEELEDIVDEFLEQSGARYWRMTSKRLRQPLYSAVRKQMPTIAQGMLQDIRENADKLLDIEELAVRSARGKPGLLTDMVETIYANEFRFIIRSGLLIGFPLGCLQAVCWYMAPVNWLLPVFGAFVGGATNWIALQVLVHPYEPTKVLGITFQGAMIRRQQEVAGLFAAHFTHGFLDVHEMMESFKEGKQGELLRRLMKRRVQRHMDSGVVTKTFDNALRLANKGEPFDETVLRTASDNLVHFAGDTKVTHKILEPIENLLASRLRGMSPAQFAGMFMPIFDENKWTLIAIGAGLGAGVGFFQLAYLFGGGTAI